MGARDKCVVDPALAESVVDMPPTLELGDRESLVTEDAVGFRGRLADELGGPWPCHATGFQVHFGSGSIPSLRGRLYLSAAVYLFRDPPIPEVRPVRHPLRAKPLTNPDGTVQMREDLVFQEPSFAALQYALMHDGKRWSVEARLYDQRPSPGAVEPLFTFERDGADLEKVSQEIAAATLARVSDLAGR